MSNPIPNEEVIHQTQPRPHQIQMMAKDLNEDVNQMRINQKMTLEDSQVIEYMNYSQNVSAYVKTQQPLENNGETNFIHIQNNQYSHEGKISNTAMQNDKQDQISTDSEGRDQNQSQVFEPNQDSFNQSIRMSQRTPKQLTNGSSHIQKETENNVISHRSRNTLQVINEPVMTTDTGNVYQLNEQSILKEVPAKITVCSQQVMLSKFHNLKFEIFAWGLNNKNQLGLQSQVSPRMFGSCKQSVLIPRQIKDIQFDTEFLASGLEHTLIVSQSGDLWGLGSNEEHALGLTPRQIDNYLNELVKIEQPLPEQNIQTIHCGHYHTIMQLQNGQIFGCGSNSNGQLGLLNGFKSVVQFTSIPIDTRNIEQISCGPYVSSFLDVQNQQLYQCGQIGGQEYTQGIVQTNLTQEIKGDNIIDVKQGQKSILAMGQSGNVYLRIQNEQFKLVQSIANAKEIGACGHNYVILTHCNSIYEWNEEYEEGFGKIENSFDKFTSFQGLTIGLDFGHVLDHDSNLYGWGNNKNGELGTGDSYPRPKLSQVRIFNNNKQYMRCYKVFAGPNHAIAVFESNISPNGIGNENNKSRVASANQGTYRSSNNIRQLQEQQEINFGKAEELNKSQKKPRMPQAPHDPRSIRRQESQSLDFNPADARKVQYQKTENALKQYRAQAQSYRDNIKRIREQLSNDEKDKNPMNQNYSYPNSIKPPKSKSISPNGFLRKDDSLPQKQLEGAQYGSVNTFSFQPSTKEENMQAQNDTAQDSYQNNFYCDEYMQNGPEELKLYLLKSKFAQKQNMKSNNFKLMSSMQVKPVTFSQQPSAVNLHNQLSNRTASTVKLNRKIENQVKNSQKILQMSKSRQSSVENRNKACLSPPQFHERDNNVINLDLSASKPDLQCQQDPSNFNFQNQRQSNQIGVVSPTSTQPYKRQQPSNDDTYDLSQSYQPGINSTEILTPDNPYKHDLPMVLSALQSRKHSYQHEVTYPTQVNYVNRLQTGNTISESENLNQSIAVNGGTTKNATNFTSYNSQAFKPGQVKQEQDFSPSPIANVNNRHQYDQFKHVPPRHNSSQHDTTTNTFNEKSLIDGVQDNQATQAKLNKYRRKLKKYISRNQEQKKEIQFYLKQAEDFQGQNARIIRCSEKEEERMQSQLKAEQGYLIDFEKIVEQERFEKQQVFNILTEENVCLLNELKDRDHKHIMLDTKMSEVQMHVTEVTYQLDTHLAENRELKQENQQLYDQQLNKDICINDLQCELENSKIAYESLNKIKTEGKDQTIQMLEKHIHELLESTKQKDKQIIEKQNKISQLKNRKKEDQRISLDLELTVKDLQSQLVLNQQQMKMIYHNSSKNAGKMSTIDEIPVFSSGVESTKSPYRRNNHIPTESQDTFTKEKSTTQSHSNMMTNTKDNNYNAADHRFDYNQLQAGVNKQMLSHTNSSGYTAQTQLNSYSYAPEIGFKNKQNQAYNQITPTTHLEAQSRNLTEINDESTSQFEIEKLQASRNNSHIRSSNYVFRDAEKKQKKHKKQRAKSGPSDQYYDYKHHHHNHLISLRNEREFSNNHHNNNPFPAQKVYSHPMSIHPSYQVQNGVGMQVNNPNFPNLNYVNQKYYNAENQSYVENQHPLAVMNQYPPSDKHTCSPGQFSQLMDSYTRNTHRQSDIPSHILTKQPYSTKDLQNKSTQVQSAGQNQISNASLTENNIMSLAQLSSINNIQTQTQQSKNWSPNPKMEEQKKENKFFGLSDTQQKQAFELYKQTKNEISPRQMDQKTQNKSQTHLQGLQRSSVVQSINQLPLVVDSQQESLIKSAMSMPLEQQSISYKDQILSKMNQKVNSIQNILNKKKERQVNKDIIKEEKVNKSEEKRETIKYDDSKFSSFDPIISESTLNKLNLSVINPDLHKSIRGRKPTKEAEAPPVRQPYTSAGNTDSSMLINAKRQNELTRIQDFHESCKSWEQRRGRSNNSSEYNKKAVISKYREAHQGLSQEIKKKMNILKKDDNEEYMKKLYN